MDNIEFVRSTMDLIEHDQGTGRMVANPPGVSKRGPSFVDCIINTCGFDLR